MEKLKNNPIHNSTGIGGIDMNQVGKTYVRPFYSELQGYLSQVPIPENVNEVYYDKSMWGQFIDTVKHLIGVTKKDYIKFKIEPITDEGSPHVFVSTNRQKLGGLILRLHGEYFSGEPAPFSGGPNTVISQTQSQSTYVQMLLDIQTTIDRALEKSENSKEQNGFLTKLKSTLGSISDVNELVKQILRLGKDYGLTLGQILILFWRLTG